MRCYKARISPKHRLRETLRCDTRQSPLCVLCHSSQVESHCSFSQVYFNSPPPPPQLTSALPTLPLLSSALTSLSDIPLSAFNSPPSHNRSTNISSLSSTPDLLISSSSGPSLPSTCTGTIISPTSPSVRVTTRSRLCSRQRSSRRVDCTPRVNGNDLRCSLDYGGASLVWMRTRRV